MRFHRSQPPQHVDAVQTYYAQVKQAAKRVFGPEWSTDESFRGVVLRSARKTEDLLSRGKSLRGGSSIKLRTLSFHYFDGRATKLCGLILAAAKKHKAMSAGEALQLAKEIDLRRPCEETVRVIRFPKKKQSPGKSLKLRTITVCGLIRTTYQRIFRDWLRAIMVSPPGEFARAGRGRESAVKELLANLNAGEAEYLVLFDGVDFFPSISNEMLTPLIPLPHSVRQACLFIEKGAPNETHTYGVSPSSVCGQSDVLTGLSQGSVASPDVASFMMHDLMKACPADCYGQSYVDDGVILASNRQEALSIQNALNSRAQAQPGGPISLKILIGRPRKNSGIPLEYLGYRFRPGAKGKVRVTPTPSQITNLMLRIRDTLRHGTPDQLNSLGYGIANRWRKSQAAWDFKPGAGIFWAQVDMVVLGAQQWHAKKAELKKPKPPPSPLLALLKNNALPPW